MQKKWLVVSIIASVLAAGMKLHGYVSENSEKGEIFCSYSVSEDKWTADPENGKVFRHNKISGVGLIIDERQMGVNYGNMGLGAESMVEELKKAYTSNGMTCEIGESVEIGDTEWVVLYAENGEGVKMLQNTAMQGDSVYIVTYIADDDVYEVGLPDFQEVFESFKFSE